MKVLMVYESTHHGNTKKLVDAVAAAYPVDTVDIQQVGTVRLEDYDVIGIASGIAFGKFYAGTEKFAEQRLPADKKVFFLYTCGLDTGRYASHIRKTAEKRNCQVLGVYGCLGYDTYGPWKLVGGVAKGHPTEEEIRGAVKFYGDIIGGAV